MDIYPLEVWTLDDVPQEAVKESKITVRTTIYVSPLQQAIDKVFAQDRGVFFGKRWNAISDRGGGLPVSPENHGTLNFSIGDDKMRSFPLQTLISFYMILVGRGDCEGKSMPPSKVTLISPQTHRSR